MSEAFWYAVIRVLGKLKLWKPYIYMNYSRRLRN